MNEVKLRSAFRKGVGEYGHAVSIENTTGVGTPDLNICVDGHDVWFEAKYFKEWPKRKTTSIKLGSKNKASWAREKSWLRKRMQHGGVCFILLRVGNSHFIMRAFDTLACDGEFSQQELFDKSIISWTRADWRKIVDAIAIHAELDHKLMETRFV